MTTIAACLASRTMAADSRSVVTDHAKGDTAIACYKLIRTRSWIIGAAGYEADIQSFIAWARGGRKGKRQKVTHDFEALLLSRTKLLYVSDAPGEATLPEEARDGYMAIGTGSNFALGAMTSCRLLGGLNVDPVHAVQVACQHDPGSREPIDFMEWPI